MTVFSSSTNAQLFINEFLASNDFSFPGPQGDYPDWIEIYNAGDEAVMLGGYYMSDVLDDPEAMFQISSAYPDSVTVSAGGFIVFYANKGEASSVMNLNFKLSGSGEQIGLWSPEQLILDSLTYGPQISDTSYGRFSDGTENWLMMPDFSPGEPNRYTNAVHEINMNASLNQNYPNPFRNKTKIEFTMDETDHVTMAVYTMSGSLVENLTNKIYTTASHSIHWDASGLPAGYYIYSIQTSKGIEIRKAAVVK